MKSAGFTLIELIIVLVIIGILAVSVSPVFFDNSGAQSQTAQLKTMSILRAVQQKAMQDTTTSYHVAVTQTTFGTPPYTEENNLQISNVNGVSFSPDGINIGFSALGRPTQDCDGGCTVTLTESSGISRVISINKEGFIDAQ